MSRWYISYEEWSTALSISEADEDREFPPYTYEIPDDLVAHYNAVMEEMENVWQQLADLRDRQNAGRGR